MNLLQNMNNAADLANTQRNMAPDQFYKAYKSLGTDPNLGQLGFINSLTVNHNLENRDAGVFEKIDKKHFTITQLLQESTGQSYSSLT